MARCGFVTIYDPATNLNNVITITSYACAVVRQINNEESHSVYKLSRDDFKVLERSVTVGTDIPYTLLLDICEKALILDKTSEHIVIMCFYFDANNELVVKVHRINKDAFPLPAKNIGYMWQSTYANVTEHFLGVDVAHHLTASIACDLLNNAAVSSGIVYDRLFEFSCGRLFVNASFLLKSIEGKKLLEHMMPDCKLIRSASKTICTSLRIKRSKTCNHYSGNNFYINKIVETHTKTTRAVCNLDLLSHVSNPVLLTKYIDLEAQAIRQNAAELCRQIPNVKPKDFDYLSLFDIFRAYTDADFRYCLAERVAAARKIYNANKHKNIIYIKSDGTLYCT